MRSPVVYDSRSFQDRSLNTFVYALLFLYIALAPFYVFASGLPQPADMIMALGVVIAVAGYIVQYRLSLNTTSLSLTLFLLLVASVNGLHYFMTQPDMRFALSPLMYLYNIGVFATINILFTSNVHTARRVIYYGFAAAIIIEFLYVLIMGTPGIREVGTFNNPNQLGYWALLSAAALYFIHRRPYYSLFDYGLLFLCLFIGAMSLSKATILTMPVIAGLYFFSPKTTARMRYALVTALIGVFLFAALTNAPLLTRLANWDVLDATLTRIDNIGQESDDSLEGRGYTRLIENPEYLLLGAGEGGFNRFSAGGKTIELHSSIATLLFSYGVLGLGFFGLAIYSIFRRAPLDYWVGIAVIMSHGLVHQNIRFTTFWVILAICYSTKKQILGHYEHDRRQ